MDRPSFTLGIEEEYLVVDRETRDLVAEPGEAFFEAASDALGAQVTPEFLQCQVEVGTKPHVDSGGRGGGSAGAPAGHRVRRRRRMDTR